MFPTVMTLLSGWLILVQPAPADADFAANVAKLVRQLDATEKVRREDAEQHLLKLGSRVLILLPDTAGASAEVKLRLARVRTQLETQRGEEEVLPSHVTLSGDDLSLGKVISAIQEQTGNKVVDFREQFGQQADKKVLKLDFDKVPFWLAFDQLLDQAGLAIYQYSGEPGLSLVNRAGNELPRANRGVYAGAFRIEATDVAARRDLRDPTGQSLRINVDVAWEPRLAPIAITQAGESVTATGDNGEVLPAGPRGEFEASIKPGDSSAQMPLTFSLPPRTVGKIASLKGSFSVMLPGPIETFRFENLRAGLKAEQRKGSVTVMLEQVRQNNLVWEVRVRVVYDAPGKALESHRTWALHNEALLGTPDKETINFAGLETTRQGENEIGMAYLFDVPDIKQHTFIYKAPAVLLNAAVPWDLRELPLP